MDKNYDFTAVPHGYALCLYPSCTHSEKCIRHLLTSHLPSDMEYLSIINPKCTGTDCRYFAPDRQVRYARGFTRIFDEVPFAKVRDIRQILLRRYGKELYYRYRRGTYPIPPKEQQYIETVFRTQGITHQLRFDSYEDNYEWR